MVVDIKTYQELIKKPESLKDEQISELKSIIKKYPYFQSARALYLKGLKNQESFRYNNELKVTAAYTTDRTALFDFITSKSFQNKTQIHQQISQKIREENEIDVVDAVEVIAETLEIGKPIHFTKNETHSFNEWLQLATKKPIVRQEPVATQKNPSNQSEIIDRFIENNPKIVPIDKGEKLTVDVPKNTSDKSLMTETLAKVYLEQKKFSKAVKAYEILSLKYPEKSGFFADQIRKIKILQKNKS